MALERLTQFTQRHRKSLDLAAKLIFFLLLAGFGLVAFIRGGVDFRGYYSAAVLVMRGGNPYDYAQLAPVLEEFTGFQGNNPYFYPPWYCLFFTPLTFLPYQVARLLWLLFNLVLFYVSLELLRNALDWQIDGWRRWGAYLLATLMFAVYCLISEQAGILLLFGVALILQGLKKDLPALTGLGLVILASKPQVTILVIIFLGLWLLFRRPLAILWTAVWLALLTVTASAAIPRWWVFEYTGFGQGLTHRLGETDQIAALRVNSTIYDFLTYIFSVGPILQYILVAGTGALGVALVFFVWRKFNEPAILTAALILLNLLITPYALQYDYVPLTLALFLIMMRVPLLRPLVKFVVIFLLVLSFSVLLWQEWSYQGYWQLLGIFAAFSLTMWDTGSN